MTDDRPTTLRSVELTRIGPARFKATNARGGETFFGTGGDDPDFTPVELLLAAIAGCSALDVEAITHKRVSSTTYDVHAEGHKVRDEHGNHLVDLRVTFDIVFPEGAEGDAARERVPARDGDVARPAVHRLADGAARRATIEPTSRSADRDLLDGDRLVGGAAAGGVGAVVALLGDRVDDVQARLVDGAEDRVARRELRVAEDEEELRAVGVRDRRWPSPACRPGRSRRR